MQVLPRRTVTAMLAVGVVLAGQWPGPALTAAAAAEAGRPAGGPVPVIYDSDMDFDDASTLALLCEEHKLGRIDLRAVTVANNGFGAAHRALTHARSVLDQCGLPRIPVADGATGAGVNPAPPELVTTIETVLTGALDDADHPVPPSPLSAARLIERAARTAPRDVVLLATGPMTNLADALASPGWPTGWPGST
ncbi:nucleoside hydrolase [Plantactinospora veratri]